MYRQQHGPNRQQFNFRPASRPRPPQHVYQQPMQHPEDSYWHQLPDGSWPEDHPPVNNAQYRMPYPQAPAFAPPGVMMQNPYMQSPYQQQMPYAPAYRPVYPAQSYPVVSYSSPTHSPVYPEGPSSPLMMPQRAFAGSPVGSSPAPDIDLAYFVVAGTTITGNTVPLLLEVVHILTRKVNDTIEFLDVEIEGRYFPVRSYWGPEKNVIYWDQHAPAPLSQRPPYAHLLGKAEMRGSKTTDAMVTAFKKYRVPTTDYYPAYLKETLRQAALLREGANPDLLLPLTAWVSKLMSLYFAESQNAEKFPRDFNTIFDLQMLVLVHQLGQGHLTAPRLRQHVAALLKEIESSLGTNKNLLLRPLLEACTSLTRQFEANRQTNLRALLECLSEELKNKYFSEFESVERSSGKNKMPLFNGLRTICESMKRRYLKYPSTAAFDILDVLSQKLYQLYLSEYHSHLPRFMPELLPEFMNLRMFVLEQKATMSRDGALRAKNELSDMITLTEEKILPPFNVSRILERATPKEGDGLAWERIHQKERSGLYLGRVNHAENKVEAKSASLSLDHKRKRSYTI